MLKLTVKKENRFIDITIRRIHTWKNTSDNTGAAIYRLRNIWKQNKSFNKRYRHWIFRKWLDSPLLNMKLKKGNSNKHVGMRIAPPSLEECRTLEEWNLLSILMLQFTATAYFHGLQVLLPRHSPVSKLKVAWDCEYQ